MAMPGGPADNIFQPGGRLRLDLLTEPAADALREGLRLARETRWESLRSPHVFMGLLAAPDASIRAWGERLRADVPQLRCELPQLLQHFQELFHQDESEAEPPIALTREYFSDNVIRLLREASNRAADHNRSAITSMDLLISLLTSSNSIVAEYFEQRLGVTAARLTELAVVAEHQTRTR